MYYRDQSLAGQRKEETKLANRWLSWLPLFPLLYNVWKRPLAAGGGEICCPSEFSFFFWLEAHKAPGIWPYTPYLPFALYFPSEEQLFFELLQNLLSSYTSVQLPPAQTSIMEEAHHRILLLEILSCQGCNPWPTRHYSQSVSFAEGPCSHPPAT